MRICTNCGHILSDSEETCSVCNSSLILDTSGSRDPEVHDTLSALSSLLEDAVLPDVPDLDDDLPLPAGTAAPVLTELPGEDLPDQDAETADVTESISAGSEPENISTALDDADPAAGDISASADGGTSEEEKEKDIFRIISVSMKNDEKLGSVNRGRVAAVTISLLALVSVILALFMIVIPLVQARQQDEAAKETAYMDFLRGEWLSDTFIYSGQQFPSCEIFTVGKDGTFRSEIWTSPNDRETYDPETWTLTASQTGDLHLELETSSLRVSYTDSNGTVMVYRRYIIGLDMSSLVLREYYNETMTDYYDVVFSRQEGKN